MRCSAPLVVSEACMPDNLPCRCREDQYLCTCRNFLPGPLLTSPSYKQGDASIDHAMSFSTDLTPRAKSAFPRVERVEQLARNLSMTEGQGVARSAKSASHPRRGKRPPRRSTWILFENVYLVPGTAASNVVPAEPMASCFYLFSGD
jgi:hypothetical protein